MSVAMDGDILPGRLMWHRRIWLIVPVLIVALGCDNRPELVPVSGVVLLDGQPVEKLSVTFYPPQGRAANGLTRPDGRFKLTIFKSGDGALLGEHTVTIVPMLDPPMAMPTDLVKAVRQSAPNVPPIPAEYRDFRTSDLRRNVQADGDNEFTFDLSSK